MQAPDQSHSLDIVRAAVALVWLLAVLVTPYEAFALLPQGAAEGFGLARPIVGNDRLRDILMSPGVLLCLRFITVATCLYTLVMRRPAPIALWVTVASVLTLDMAAKAFGGFANHGQAAPLFVLCVVASADSVSTWVGRASDVALRTGGSQPTACVSVGRRDLGPSAVWLARLVMIVPYTYIGMNRLLVGGSAVFEGDAIREYVMAEYLSLSSYPRLELGAVIWQSAFSPWLNAGFIITTALEVLSAGVLLGSRFRWAWLVWMTGFHISTLALMKIFFWENLILLWALFGASRKLPGQEGGARGSASAMDGAVGRASVAGPTDQR